LGSINTHRGIRSCASRSLTRAWTAFHAHSLPHGASEQTEYLRFFLTPQEVEDVEQRRHASGSDVFQL
jgi:hypothetical protein